MPAVKFYGVVTRTGADVFTSWDKVTAFLKEHPGTEFHKRFPTEEGAWEFVAEKSKALNLACDAKKVPAPPDTTPAAEMSGTVVTGDDDDAPPW